MRAFVFLPLNEYRLGLIFKVGVLFIFVGMFLDRRPFPAPGQQQNLHARSFRACRAPNGVPVLEIAKVNSSHGRPR